MIRCCDDEGRPGTRWSEPDAGREDPEWIEWTEEDVDLLFND
jgi:hypothetical protein